MRPNVRPTVRAVLADATERLRAAGVPSPRVDAELLLAAFLGVSRSQLLTHDDLPHFLVDDYGHGVSRRVAREPLQHIVGTAAFRFVEVAVGPGVFVPRPETELLVDAVLSHLRALDRPVAIDLCSGSGALALAIADEVPAARVIALESSPAALPWLWRNVADTVVEVSVGDVRDPALFVELHGQADAVVCNPPYVPSSTEVDPEVRADPGEAVFAGGDGLDLVPAVVTRAALLLRPGGVFALEHDDSHGEAVPALLRDDGRWTDISAHLDLAGRPRYAVAVRSEAG